MYIYNHTVIFLLFFPPHTDFLFSFFFISSFSVFISCRKVLNNWISPPTTSVNITFLLSFSPSIISSSFYKNCIISLFQCSYFVFSFITFLKLCIISWYLGHSLKWIIEFNLYSHFPHFALPPIFHYIIFSFFILIFNSISYVSTGYLL